MNKIKTDQFVDRHIGNQANDQEKMLQTIGVDSIETLISQTVPDNILMTNELDLPEALSEFEYLKLIKAKADKNKVHKTYIGTGYYGTITPSVI
jgi:glycine dehydrogenase